MFHWLLLKAPTWSNQVLDNKLAVTLNIDDPKSALEEPNQ